MKTNNTIIDKQNKLLFNDSFSRERISSVLLLVNFSAPSKLKQISEGVLYVT